MLEAVKSLDPVLCVPSPTRGKSTFAQPMSDAVFKALFVRMGRDGFTTHGLASRSLSSYRKPHVSTNRTISRHSVNMVSIVVMSFPHVEPPAGVLTGTKRL